MFALFKRIEQTFYNLRDLLWNYPDILFLDDNSVSREAYKFYNVARPYSHIIFSLFLCVCVALVSSVLANNNINPDQNSLIEGVVMGINEDGGIQTLDTLDPLINTKFQVGEDITNLIYEPLISVTPNGVIKHLVEDYEASKEGKVELTGMDYIFKLRRDVTWHDGSKFTSADVVATFNKIVELTEAELPASKGDALRQMGIAAIDEYTVRIFVTQNAESLGAEKKIFPNFLELVSFKVMPAAYLTEINAANVSTNEPRINRRPIGTGMYQFERVNGQQIRLRVNESFHGHKPQIESLVFQLYKTEDALVNALKNGEIHSFASTTTRQIQDLARFPRIQQYASDINYQQYWSLYFNLKNGPEYLKDKNVRKALAKAIDYELALKAVQGRGERAFGPIPVSDPYFYKDGQWPQYDINGARDLLQNAGWGYNQEGRLEKNGQVLSLTIKYTDHFDRSQIIASITKDWVNLGVDVHIDPLPLNQLKNDSLVPRLFDVLLYGMNTFIDPDRYELFHSSAIEYPGLNISGYQSESTVKKIVDQKLVDVPSTDRNLEIGRSTLDKNVRTSEYKDFQQKLIDEEPVIFLYHPSFTYYVSDAITGINLAEVTNMADRFTNIDSWQFASETD